MQRTSILFHCCQLAGRSIVGHHNVRWDAPQLGGKGQRCCMVTRAAPCKQSASKASSVIVAVASTRLQLLHINSLVHQPGRLTAVTTALNCGNPVVYVVHSLV
jgi:hypothetical protein